MPKIVYLAADLQEGQIQSRELFHHWADALVASLTEGRGRMERDEKGFMVPMENGKPVFSGCSIKENDDAAKTAAGNMLRSYLGTCSSGSRYSFVQLVVSDDEASVIVETESHEDSTEYMDAMTYGVRAYGLRMLRV